MRPPEAVVAAQRYVRGMSVERLRGAVERSYLGAVDDEVAGG